MPNLGAALEAAIAKITRREVAAAVKDMKKGMKRLESAIGRVGQRRSGGGPTRGRREDAGPTMAPAEVRALRKRLKLTQQQFGNATGVTHVAVYFWESGRTRPVGARLKALRALEKMSVADAAARFKGGATAAAGKGPARKSATRAARPARKGARRKKKAAAKR